MHTIQCHTQKCFLGRVKKYFDTNFKRGKRFLNLTTVERKEDKWIPVIGLEIHAQINSKSKLFSSASNHFMASPNSLVSSFDAALPGTLPVINKQCVESVILTALALNCKINKKSYFDRKQYFYADLPQGYQITQQRKPIAVHGHLTIPVASEEDGKTLWKQINIEQIQLEQDSGKSLHDDVEKKTLIDLNRAGVGLMEIVTAPDFSSSEEAVTFVQDLKLTMSKLNTCRGKISEGQMRVDANISVHQKGQPFGTRTEVKNIAGIRHLKLAIEFEIGRQIEALTNGKQIVNETREFDAEKRITIAMRDKEEKQDYRFLPEPNLPPLILYDDQTQPSTEFSKDYINTEELMRKLPSDLPSHTRQILIKKFGLDVQKSSFLLENGVGDYFIQVIQINPDLSIIKLYDWVRIALLGLLNEHQLIAAQSPVSPYQMAELLSLLDNDEVNNDFAMKSFTIMAKKGLMPNEIVDQMDWRMIKNHAVVRALCIQAVESMDNGKLLRKYTPGNHTKSGNKKATASVVSAVLSLSNGKAHTKITQGIVREMLDEMCRTNKIT